MAQKVREWAGRNGVDVHYNDRLYYASPTVRTHHLSRFDCFHPSRSGQMKFAYEIWSGFNHGNEQINDIFIDEFDTTDYCTQEFGDWGSCWIEANDDNAATSGDIQITGNVLSMRSGSKQISRAMDLQHIDHAWITFNRRRDGMSEDDLINAETHDVFALETHVFVQQVSNTGAELAVPQQIAEGVRGGDVDPL